MDTGVGRGQILADLHRCYDGEMARPGRSLPARRSGPRRAV